MKLFIFGIIFALVATALATADSPSYTNKIKCYENSITKIVNKENNATLVWYLGQHRRLLANAREDLEKCSGLSCVNPGLTALVSIGKISTYLKQNRPGLWPKIEQDVKEDCGSSFFIEDKEDHQDFVRKFKCTARVIDTVVAQEKNETLSSDWAPRNVTLIQAISDYEKCNKSNCTNIMIRFLQIVQSFDQYLIHNELYSVFRDILANLSKECTNPEELSLELLKSFE